MRTGITSVERVRIGVRKEVCTIRTADKKCYISSRQQCHNDDDEYMLTPNGDARCYQELAWVGSWCNYSRSEGYEDRRHSDSNTCGGLVVRNDVVNKKEEEVGLQNLHAPLTARNR